MIRVHYLGRLGTNLFQYCFGRILAAEMGLNFRAPRLPGFSCEGFVRRRWLPLRYPVGETLEGHVVDLKALAADPRPRRIDVRGHFQRYEYYRPHKQVIRTQWLHLPRNYQPGPDSLSIHIRGGDIWESDGGAPVHEDYPALPYSFYREIIESRDWSSIHVVTDDAGDLMARKLAEVHGAEIRSESVLEDFNFLCSSSHIVLSVSSFAWWGAWLSDARQIHFPVAGLLDPEHRPEVDLRVDDDPRYVYHRPACLLPWEGKPDDRERLLEL